MSRPNTVTIDGEEVKLTDLKVYDLNTEQLIGVVGKPLRPVVTEEKQQYFLGLLGEDGESGFKHNAIDLSLTKPQAQALATATQALVEYLQTPHKESDGRSAPATGHLFDTMRQTWHALQSNTAGGK